MKKPKQEARVKCPACKFILKIDFWSDMLYCDNTDCAFCGIGRITTAFWKETS